MRTEVTYLDKNKKQVNKEEAWTVVTKIYNDAGNLQRTGYSIGEAQKKAGAGASAVLNLTDLDTGKENTFAKTVVKAGREAPCDLIISIPEKKKIDKVHAMFEYREQQWYVMDMSKSGVFINDARIPGGRPFLLHSGDVIDFAGKKKYRFG